MSGGQSEAPKTTEAPGSISHMRRFRDFGARKALLRDFPDKAKIARAVV